MPSKSFELEPAESLVVATDGVPGQRQFFLRAQGGGQTVTLACEKAQVQALVGRIKELLESQGLEAGLEKPNPRPPGDPGPLEPEWSIGELGLGYHESRKMYVVVAREDTQDPEPAVARFWAGADQVRHFARHAQSVLSAGRPTCSHCGLPVDPAGHPCPAANGSRPIF
jgi:uncharacterized repeat protein (TIGR03847 family)